MSQQPLNISICIVLYRSEEGTKIFHQELMESLREQTGFEVNYYDNSPTDALRIPLEAHPYGDKVNYFNDKRNLGFSYANNRLILMARYKKILLLNPDVYGFSMKIWNFIDALIVSETAVFARLKNSDGSFQDCIGEVASIRRAFSPRINYGAIQSPTKIGMGIMAFMLTEKDVFARVGLLDCSYSLYAEDMDWCYRASRLGYSLIYEPNIVLTHTGGASAKDRWSTKATLRRKYLAERIFIDIHFRGIYWTFMRILNAIKRFRLLIGT